jgi:predicted Zn-dependent protease
VAAQYGRIIAYHRKSKSQIAIRKLDTLIKRFPKDPFLHELKGQILFEQGHAAKAVPIFEQALKLMPGQPLILLALGQSMIATNDAELNRDAIQILRNAVLYEPQLVLAWQQLAIATGREGLMADSALASAEHAFIQKHFDDARMFARRAVTQLPAGSPGSLRAQDILVDIKRQAANKSKQ